MSSPTPTQTVTVPTFHVLGVRVHAVQILELLTIMERWVQERQASHYIAFTGMHGVAEAQESPFIRAILNEADLVVPDGMSLVWLGRMHGYPLKRRVYGPELMETFCCVTGSKYLHFFYGGAPGVPDLLAEVLERRHRIRVAGTYSPPFRAPTSAQEEELVAGLERISPDVIWVGLSTPKQERWMYEHRDRLKIPVMAGVGAAFDLVTGRLPQAPSWMREHGLEWLFRFAVEPRRLWRRNLVLMPKFAVNASLELLKVRRFR